MNHTTAAADYIQPLHINGLEGRSVRHFYQAQATPNLACVWTPRTPRTLVGFGGEPQEFGHVTMPDLPGFGGMDGFQKIGRQPDIDAYADYLAAFVTLQYRRKRVTIIGISFGFVVVSACCSVTLSWQTRLILSSVSRVYASR